ncbi:hypothetical protein LHK_01565 [Laribacter hongkongensis HLHK9]|uniref:Uncharacterized protein n=1 Tax=Laribacter hongkongensis (strain HLHK9) TaxID=557598 RepID=C1D7W3_LARHH|nr:hypothetical protein LHK_01565 [Laribacter hongkongensis HLHK9]
MKMVGDKILIIILSKIVVMRLMYKLLAHTEKIIFLFY